MDAELIPGERQTLWGRLAVANFFLGGAGAGAYVVAVVLAGVERSPLFAAASLFGPGLVIAGFLCVAAEAGRPWRGPRVLRMLQSSWMSRELWAGGAFILLAAVDLSRSWVGFRILAGLAALVLISAQGLILCRARGVAAWNVPLMPFVFLTSGLAGGAGLLGMLSPLAGEGARARLLWGTAALTLVSAAGWISYLAWPGDAAFCQATAPLRQGGRVLWVLGAGHLVPLLLLTVALWLPDLAAGALFLAGAGILIGALQAKAWLVLRAGQLRPVTIPALKARLSSAP